MNANPEDPPMQAPPPSETPSVSSAVVTSAARAGPALTNPDARIQGGSLRLFRVAGIDVWLHWSWLFFAMLRLQPASANDPLEFAHYDAQIWYLIEYLVLFGFVLLHEFGHVLACRSVGGTSNSIMLWPLGGIALVDPPARPGALLWSIAAGPLVNVVLLLPTIGFWLASGAVGWQETLPDVYRFAAALAWMNGYLLVFNLLPIFPLDGGKILQALLWFCLSRVRSTLVATVVGLATALGLLVVAIVERSLVWGIMAGLGVLFCLLGVQGARGLRRMLEAPRRTEAACPGCGAAPPCGKFWACTRCFRLFDVFAAGGACPNCGTPLAAVLCADCGRSPPYAQWRVGDQATEVVVPTPAPPANAVRPPTVTQRIFWSVIFAFMALAVCGVPSAEEQPLGLILWTVGGAILGATSAGTMTRTFKSSHAQRKLRGTWNLVEVDGQTSAEAAATARDLKLNYGVYEERLGDVRVVAGTCWTDPLAEPPAISFTAGTGEQASEPRQGIYRLDGNALTICLAYPGHPRPIDFVARPEIQQLRLYRRAGKAGA